MGVVEEHGHRTWQGLLRMRSPMEYLAGFDQCKGSKKGSKTTLSNGWSNTTRMNEKKNSRKT